MLSFLFSNFHAKDIIFDDEAANLLFYETDCTNHLMNSVVRRKGKCKVNAKFDLRDQCFYSTFRKKWGEGRVSEGFSPFHLDK